MQHRLGDALFVEDQTFGDFEFQAGARTPRGGEGRHQVVDEAFFVQLAT